MTKIEEYQKQFLEMERKENSGYIWLPHNNYDTTISHCSVEEIYYFFKKKEELRKLIN
jgi:hypothetical protein